MLLRRIDTVDVPNWLAEVASQLEVWAPTLRGPNDVVLAPFDEERLTLDYGRLAEPVKRILLPQADAIFGFERGEVEGNYDTTRRMLFGLRPCDAAAIVILDEFFRQNFVDPHYFSRRQNMVLAVLACSQPEQSCFCASAGTGPVAEGGFDLQFFDFGDYYLVETGSEEGEKLLTDGGRYFKEPSADYGHRLDEFRKKAESSFITEVGLERAAQLVRGRTDLGEFWQWVAERCMMCGGCAYLCPTCTCFDFYDRTEPTEKGERIRIWDSCIFAGFTREASGHNPRGQQDQRCYRRYEHKLESPDPGNLRFRCVGCGRCVDACLSELGMVQVVKKLLEWVDSKTGGREQT